MSVAGEYSASINEAARQLVVNEGVTIVAAAGNAYASACQLSPASSPYVITVGAMDITNKRWAKSNW